MIDAVADRLANDDTTLTTVADQCYCSTPFTNILTQDEIPDLLARRLSGFSSFSACEFPIVIEPGLIVNTGINNMVKRNVNNE